MEITLKKLYAIQEKVVVFENKNKKLQEQLMIIKDKVMTIINLVQKVKEIKSVLIIYNPNAMKGKIGEHIPQIKQRLLLRFAQVD